MRSSEHGGNDKILKWKISDNSEKWMSSAEKTTEKATFVARKPIVSLSSFIHFLYANSLFFSFSRKGYLLYWTGGIPYTCIRGNSTIERDSLFAFQFFHCVVSYYNNKQIFSVPPLLSGHTLKMQLIFFCFLLDYYWSQDFIWKP